MVVRANKAEEGIGGHISTYASAATLYIVPGPPRHTMPVMVSPTWHLTNCPDASQYHQDQRCDCHHRPGWSAHRGEHTEH
jgi:hypothetical protein